MFQSSAGKPDDDDSSSNELGEISAETLKKSEKGQLGRFPIENIYDEIPATEEE